MSTGALRILLVEDSTPDAMLVQEYLAEALGTEHTVTHVVRAREAVERLEEDHVDVILLDLLLPDAMGVECVSMIRDAAPKSAIVVISGVDDEQVTASALDAGAQGYLLKDHVDAELLKHALKVAVARLHAADGGK
ncbi:response regulator transcription factor [Candidatus Poribacteria bacterium]|nr:response regulator transcription factor [Candidatus Poribacteria bacterium]MBT5710442.1 response regulator transcription factor [Candidatus Poribacteria bacterium]MBT7097362.1 response regulator transcription factor [Candidatus Poribacteria bacterium]MBT7807423.1 response regulator transcription factor [Candidatus Poribacteria bacterium]